MFLLDKSYWQIRTTKKKGRGVFAKKNIKAGSVIGDYLGKVILSKEETKYEEKYGLYAMYYNDRISIFPNIKKPGIHIINHSCKPNCWMYTYKGHTLYFAISDIKKGEELTVSYLLEPKEDCDSCNHDCYCARKDCIKTMHTPKKKFDKWVECEEKLAKKTKAKKAEINAFLSPLSEYPSSLFLNFPFHKIS